MSDLFDDWTRDAKGKYIDWTQPPYYVNGVLNVLLPDERDISSETISKRITEYSKLTRRSLARRNKNAPGAMNSPGRQKKS